MAAPERSMCLKLPAPIFKKSGEILEIRGLSSPEFEAGIENRVASVVYAVSLVLADVEVKGPPADKKPLQDFRVVLHITLSPTINFEKRQGFVSVWQMVEIKHRFQLHLHLLRYGLSGSAVSYGDITYPVGFILQGEGDSTVGSIFGDIQAARQGVAVNQLGFCRPGLWQGLAGHCLGGEKGKIAAAGMHRGDKEEGSGFVKGVDKKKTGVTAGGEIQGGPSQRNFLKMNAIYEIGIQTF